MYPTCNTRKQLGAGRTAEVGLVISRLGSTKTFRRYDYNYLMLLILKLICVFDALLSLLPLPGEQKRREGSSDQVPYFFSSRLPAHLLSKRPKKS